jgi:hypothetical protein
MNPAQRTAEDWKQLLKSPYWQDIEWDRKPPLPPFFPDLRPVAVRIETETLADPAAVERKLAGFPAHAGWVERQSGTEFFEAGGFPGDARGFGPVVSAELAGEREGLSVRLVPGGWIVAHIAEEEGAVGDCLAHDTAFAGIDHLPVSGQVFGRKPNYRVYWRHEQEHGWRQFAARLLGFEGGQR